MKRLLTASVFTLGLFVMAEPAAPVESLQVERCFEDQPCWDCNTMGNMICGEGSAEDVQEHADAAWEGLSSEEQNYLNSIGASDQEVIDFRFSDRIIPQIAEPAVLVELPRTF